MHYYTEAGDTADTLDELLAKVNFKPELDYEALAEYFCFQYCLDGKTLLKNVRVHHPAMWVPFEPSRRSWKLKDVLTPLDEALSRAVADCTPGAGLLLGGGVDSGLIAAMSMPRRKCFTGWFNVPVKQRDSHFNEKDRAIALADHTDSSHLCVEIGAPDAMLWLGDTVNRLGWPVASACYQDNMLLSAASKHVDTVIDGDGGDELFGSYPWRLVPMLACRDQHFEKDYYHAWTRFYNDHTRRGFFSRETNAKIGGYSTYEAFCRETEETEGLSPIERAMVFDCGPFLASHAIMQDSLAASYGMFFERPYLADGVRELALSLPVELKVGPEEQKMVLRELAKKYLPVEFSKPGGKMGYVAPDWTWYATEPNKSYLYDLTMTHRGIFNLDTVDLVWQEHVSGKRDHRQLIWSLAAFEVWARKIWG